MMIRVNFALNLLILGLLWIGLTAASFASTYWPPQSGRPMLPYKIKATEDIQSLKEWHHLYGCDSGKVTPYCLRLDYDVCMYTGESAACHRLGQPRLMERVELIKKSTPENFVNFDLGSIGYTPMKLTERELNNPPIWLSSRIALIEVEHVNLDLEKSEDKQEIDNASYWAASTAAVFRHIDSNWEIVGYHIVEHNEYACDLSRANFTGDRLDYFCNELSLTGDRFLILQGLFPQSVNLR